MRVTNIILLVLFLCCSSVVFGQKQEITREKFNAAEEKASGRQPRQNYRITTKNESFVDGKIEKTQIIIYESLLPDRSRSKSTDIVGNKSTEFEQIRIGYYEYTRIDGGKWEKRDLRGSRAGVGSLLRYAGKTLSSKYMVAAEKLDDQPVQVYEEYTEVEETLGLRYNRRKFWVDANGVIFRRASEYGHVNPEKLVSSSVTTYEYNLKDLKIEAPLKPKKP